jgi:hypothetical protein
MYSYITEHTANDYYKWLCKQVKRAAPYERTAKGIKWNDFAYNWKK